MYLNLKRRSAFFDRMPVPLLSRWYRGMVTQIRANHLQNLDFQPTIALYEEIFGQQNVLVLPLERLIVEISDARDDREKVIALLEQLGC